VRYLRRGAPTAVALVSATPPEGIVVLFGGLLFSAA
jgi:hypothetical protein